jgi:hypothetical protein
MRSQVQVLAGPPAIPAGHSAVGQRAGSARCQPGPRWGRTPIPAGRPTGPSGPGHPGVRHHDYHSPWSPTSPRAAATRPLRPPRAAACSRAHSAAVSDSAPHAGQPCLVPQRSSAAAALTQPGPGPPPTPTDQRATPAASPASGPARPSTEPLHGVTPTGTSTRSCGAGCPPHRPGPQRHRPRWDETDASGRTGADSSRLTHRTGGHRTGGHRTAGHQTAGHQTGWDTGHARHQTAGHWTAGPPDPGRRNRMGGHRMLDADRRPMPWQVSWPYRPRRQRPTAGCRLDAPPGSRHLGD